MNEASPKSLPVRKLVLFALVVFLAAGAAAYFVLPDPIDWRISYRPAALALLAGESPYTDRPFYNPPWVLLPLVPFAVLPFRLGAAAFFAANLAGFCYIGWRLGARPIALAALICSFPVAFCLLFGQIDALVLMGLFMPHWLGLIFILIKPQIGAAVALFWLFEAWRGGGWRQALRTFAPVTAVFLLSFAIFGFWPLYNSLGSLIATEHNSSPWPISLLIGVPLLIHALRSRKENFALMSAPFFSPYVSIHTWSLVLLGLIPYPLEMIGACLASWAIALVRMLP